MTNDVRTELYRYFVEEGRVPSVEELARGTGVPADAVRDALRQLEATDVIAFKPGTEDVWLVHPFCAEAGPYRVISGDRQWDAICIWDALGVLALTEADGAVTGSCPDCGGGLEVRVAGGRIEAPSGSVVHFGVPAARWYEDIAFT